jgi:hypothetical protein
VVERGGLENRYACKGIGGSNPSPSANNKTPVLGVLLLADAGSVNGPRFGTKPPKEASVNAERSRGGNPSSSATYLSVSST